MFDQSLIPGLYRTQKRTAPTYPEDPLAYYNEYPSNFEFAGYRFYVGRRFVRLALPIVNPHPAHAFLSYRTITQFPADYPLSTEQLTIEIRLACAWLLAHWWEHALNMCPCQHDVEDETQESEFRTKVVTTLLRAVDKTPESAILSLRLGAAA